MTRHLFLAVQAWGDNVVSLRLLNELRGHADLEILGTDLTRQVAQLLGFNAFPMRYLPGGTSSVYNVAEAGIFRAAKDFLTLRTALAAAAEEHTVVLFENQRRRRTHRALQLLGGNFRYYQPQWGHSAYSDRGRMLEEVFGTKISLAPAALPPSRIRRLVIAPAARKGFRRFPVEIVAQLFDYGVKLGAEVGLLDPNGEYTQFRDRAAAYVTGKPLADSLQVLKSADLLIATDSLFMHLAYYLAVATIALVPAPIARSFYFAPPGLLDRKLFLSFDAARNRELLFAFLDSHLRP